MSDPEGCGVERIIPHAPGGLLDHWCLNAHLLFGEHIVYLPLAGFGFAALTGIGGGLILDNYNKDRKWRLLGWCLVLLCLPLASASMFFGLP
jgi:hypothetical protein